MRLSEQYAYDKKCLHLPFGQYYSVCISVAIKSLWKTGLNLWHMDSRKEAGDKNIKVTAVGGLGGKQFWIIAPERHNFMETKIGDFLLPMRFPTIDS